MRLKKLWVIVLLSGIVGYTISKKCHYSCEQCIEKSHVSCTKCVDGSELHIVKNQTSLPYNYRDGTYNTGICGEYSSSKYVNALGIILFVSCLLLIHLTRSPLLFYIFTTLQTLNLLSFIEIGWINPTGYLLRALQWLTPYNLMTWQVKYHGVSFVQYSFYFLDLYFIEPYLEKSLYLLGTLNIVFFVLIIILQLFQKTRYLYFKDSFQGILCLKDLALLRILNYFKALFFLLIQETILSIVIAFRFQPSLTHFSTGATIAYIIMLVIFTAYVSKFKITYFSNRLVQFFFIVKKVILPIFAIVPYDNQFLLIMFMAIICALEMFFDVQIDAYTLKSRNFTFKVIYLVTILMSASFYAADTHSTSKTAPLVFNYILTICLCICIASAYIESAFSFYSRFSAPKILSYPNAPKIVPYISMVGRDQNSTLMTTKRNETYENISQPNNVTIIREELVYDEIMPPKVYRESTKDSNKDSSFKTKSYDKKVPHHKNKSMKQLASNTIPKDDQREKAEIDDMVEFGSKEKTDEREYGPKGKGLKSYGKFRKEQLKVVEVGQGEGGNKGGRGKGGEIVVEMKKRYGV